jgi:hypothetical protein
MSIQISSMHQWKMYLDGIMKKAHHHAPNVVDIIPTIIGNINIYADPNEIHVGSVQGEMKNVIWFCVADSEDWYYFRYDHDNQSIDMMYENRNGPVIARFDNQSTVFEIKAIFEKIWRQAKAA